MKLFPSNEAWTVLMTFGSAKLLIDREGRLEMRGGSRADHVSAREWISLFMHEAVPRVHDAENRGATSSHRSTGSKKYSE